MNQLSIIYLIMGSVLLVGVMLISISPDTHNTPVINQKVEAVVGLANINSDKAIESGIGKIRLYLAANNGQLNEKAKFYANTSPYTSGIITVGLIFDIIRKARGEGVDTPWPFLPQGH